MQVGIVVPDLEQALEQYSSAFGLGPWIGFRLDSDTVRDFTYRGSPATYTIDLALTGSNPQIELLQVNGENTFYHEHIDRHGFGIQHLGIKVDNALAVIDELVGNGYDVLQSGHGYGRDGDGRFAYLDTVADLGWILEVIQPPAARRQPDFIWPPPRA